MTEEKKIRQILVSVIIISILVRGFLAAFLELGNDEVYYWTYAKFPDLSHFDHPPMVGLIIQLFTLNLHFDQEFFLRLASIVFGAVNTWLVFLLGRLIRDSITGLYASLLYTGSFYCSILAGTFILPDSPQVFFWLISLYLLLNALPDKSLSRRSRNFLLLAGVSTGFALLSKYHSVFLVSGVFLYILFFNRKWFRAKETYLSFLIVIVMFIPVLLWNYQNQFISFTFHEGRIDAQEAGIRWNYFGTEMIGQVFYNNPVNFILIILAFIAVIRGRRLMDRNHLWLLLLISLPLTLIFIGFSLFNATLPHWTGPAYLGFILIAAAYLGERSSRREKMVMIPVAVKLSIGLLLIVVVLASGQITRGWIPVGKLGFNDISRQLYGWNELGEKFKPLSNKYTKAGIMDPKAPVISFRWFPAANFDYYVARPAGTEVYAIGELNRIHKYYWIDKERGPLKKGINAWFIALSDDFQDPHNLYPGLFDSIPNPDTLHILRGKEEIRQAYVFRLMGLRKEIVFDSMKVCYR